uniref:Uncharacterized protein n=1 Tax=Glossina palpalis gambiensis TaxID=67801 RepID=A0A1B0BKV1_9MUSC
MKKITSKSPLIASYTRRFAVCKSFKKKIRTIASEKCDTSVDQIVPTHWHSSDPYVFICIFYVLCVYIMYYYECGLFYPNPGAEFFFFSLDQISL